MNCPISVQGPATIYDTQAHGGLASGNAGEVTAAILMLQRPSSRSGSSPVVRLNRTAMLRLDKSQLSAGNVGLGCVRVRGQVEESMALDGLAGAAQ